MKKILTLITLLLATLALSSCSSITRAIRGDQYADNQLKSQEQTKALTANPSAFPQLNKEISDKETHVLIKTSKGEVTLKLFPEYAPLAVENFVTHAKEGYYDGLSFHRVIEDFMVQAGDPKGEGTGGQSIWKGKDDSIDSGSGFKNETSPYLYHIRGALAMANAGPNTNGSQFFIVQNQKDWSNQLPNDTYPKEIIKAYANGGYPSLDGSYTVFGQVLEGMDIVDEIAQVATDSQDKPKSAITIESITIIKEAN